MAAGFPSEQVIQDREAEATTSFMTYASEVTGYHFRQILLVTHVSPVQRGIGLHKDMNTRKQGSLGAILKASYHIHHAIQETEIP